MRTASKCLAAWLALSACDETETNEHDHTPGEQVADDAAVTGDANAANCSAATPRKPTDIQETGSKGVMVAKVMQADYEPPRRYANRWVIALQDTAGVAIAQASFTQLRTWMAVHGHDGRFAPTVREDAQQPGSYVFDSVYFTMTGPWELQFDVSAGDRSDSFALDVCVGD